LETDFGGLRAGLKYLGFAAADELSFVVEVGAGAWWDRASLPEKACDRGKGRENDVQGNGVNERDDPARRV
jgi:hypothetical protein